MKTRSVFKSLILCALLAFPASYVAAANTHVLLDGKEIGAFLSGYDIKSVTFTLDANDTLTLEIEPYGVPGDTDGDSNPDASSDPQILDEPGVGSLEFLQIGLVCANTTVCAPDINFIYNANTLTNDNPAAGPASMSVTTSAYVLTIPNFTTFKANLGGSPANFGAFNFVASFGDSQPDDLAPELDAGTGMPVCESVSLEPPTPSKFPFDCYSVNKVKVKDKPGTDSDKIKVTKAGFRLDAPNTVDLLVDEVQMRVDGLTFTFPPGSFEQKGNNPDYVFKSATGVKPKIEARLRFDKASWELSVKDGDASLIDNSDGVDVALMIGGFETVENVVLDAKGKFEREPKVSCRHATSDSSDSGTPAMNKMSCIGSMTVQYGSDPLNLITKTRAGAELLHPNTVFTDGATGDMAIIHTSCSACLQCGDVNGNFTIMEIEGLPGDKMAQKCLVPDASCSLLPE